MVIEDGTGCRQSIPMRRLNPFVTVATKGIGRERFERDDDSLHNRYHSRHSQCPPPLRADENSFDLKFVELVEPSPIKLEDFIHSLGLIETRIRCSASFVCPCETTWYDQNPSPVPRSFPSGFRPSKTDILQICLSHSMASLPINTAPSRNRIIEGVTQQVKRLTISNNDCLGGSRIARDLQSRMDIDLIENLHVLVRSSQCSAAVFAAQNIFLVTVSVGFTHGEFLPPYPRLKNCSLCDLFCSRSGLRLRL
jgi:hypothetical protein